MEVISLFSGAGGFDWGFHQEGFEVIQAIDIDQDACNTYALNFPETKVICTDLNQISLEATIEADLIIGGPPCQGFSLAGLRRIGDPRNALVWKYMDIIKEIRPKAFIMENVMDLKSARDKNNRKVLPQLKMQFNHMGYTLDTWELNAAYYGVPQLRKRIFIVGTSDGTMIAPPVRTHSPSTVVTAKQALGDLGEPTFNGLAILTQHPQNLFQNFCRYIKQEIPTVTHHFKTEATPAEKRMIPYVKPGGNYKDIPDSAATIRVMRHKEEGGRTTTYARLHPDKPSYTVNAHFHTMNLGSNVHYDQDRIITVREGMRLQSFPDDFQIMSSTKAGYYKQVGNAVPPLLSLSIAERMKEYLSGEYVMAKNLKRGF